MELSMQKLLSVLALGLVLGVVGCDGGGGSDRANTIAGLSGDAASGETLFTAQCASCHGADAKSGSANENLVEAVGEGAEFIDVVLDGKDNGAMPAFKDTLSDQEIADIIAWLETL
jgi:cytochrome c oxidase subunit 2